MLDETQIVLRNIVQYSQRQQNARNRASRSGSAQPRFGMRESTYDATVGMIISDGTQEGPTYMLPPRGVIWVVSEEEFHLPEDVTALAALRTTWAHKGIFALNVGVVDPGWKGPVSTALVNFSTEDFTVSRGDPFMRLMFFEHAVTHPTVPAAPAANYLKQVKKNSHNFSTSFLNMGELVDDVSRKIFAMPKLGVVAAWIAIIVALFATILPIAYSLITGIHDDKVSMVKIEQRLQALEQKKPTGNENSQKSDSGSGVEAENKSATSKSEKEDLLKVKKSEKSTN